MNSRNGKCFIAATVMSLALTVALSGCNSGSGTDANTSTSSGPGVSGSGTPPPAAGSATLSWQAPATNTDGSALTDLAGYHIYYGTSSANLDQIINVASVGITTYVIDNLSAGTYYFEISAYTTAGIEGAMSPTVSKTI